MSSILACLYHYSYYVRDAVCIKKNFKGVEQERYVQEGDATEAIIVAIQVGS